MKKKNNKKSKKLIIEKSNQTENKEKIKKEINEILNDLTVEELTEIENMGDFSKEAIEWIRAKKKKKKMRKQQENFEKSLKCSQEIIRRTELIGKIMGFKNNQYKPKSADEKNEIIQAIEEEEVRVRIREKEKEKQLEFSSSKKRDRDEKIR